MYNAIQCIKAGQGHPRSLISVTIDSAYCDCLLLITSNVGPNLHRSGDTTTERPKIATFSRPLSFNAVVLAYLHHIPVKQTLSPKSQSPVVTQ